MELRRLRYFCAVAAEGHLGRAADGLGIRSTSLSQQIRALEQELETVLFVRTPGGMVPTEAAMAFLPEARAVLAAAARARAVIRSTEPDRRLRLGVTPGSPAWLPRTLFAAVRARGAALDPVDLQTAAQLDALARADLDAGVVVLPVDAPGCEVAVVSDAAMGVVVGPTHRLAGRPTVDWAALTGSALMWFPREFAPGYHDAVLREAQEAGWIPAEIRRRPPRRDLFAAEVSDGEDVVALRPADDNHAAHGLRWIPFTADPPRLRHALVWPADHSRASVFAAVAGDLRREARPHGREASPRGRR